MRSPLLSSVVLSSSLLLSKVAFAAGAGAPPVHVLELATDDADDQAKALTRALKDRVKASKDYALAEDQFRLFLQRYPSDRLTPDAHYWLGESLFQRQRYLDAAESFLTVSTKFENAGKAPDALLRLGQALAALGEEEQACAAFGRITVKYPRASSSIKHGVDREQKRARC